MISWQGLIASSLTRLLYLYPIPSAVFERESGGYEFQCRSCGALNVKDGR